MVSFFFGRQFRETVKTLCVAYLILLPTAVRADSPLFGEYVEVKTRGVWFGPRTDGEESRPIGELAILGWKVEEGTWDRQDLSGLKVAAVLRIEAPVADSRSHGTKAILYVDKQASEAQAAALVSMVRTLAGKTIEEAKQIIGVKSVPIILSTSGPNDQPGEGLEENSGESRIKLEIENILKVHTVAKSHEETCLCGRSDKEVVSLAETKEQLHARILENLYRATGLEVRSTDPHRTHALVGMFSL